MNILGPDDSGRKLFPRGPGLGLKTLALLAICAGLIAGDLRGEDLQGPRGWMSWAMTPLVWLAQIPTRLTGVIEHLESRERLIDENTVLRRKQLQLEAALARMAALQAENRRIRELLDSTARIEDQVLIAEIIAANQDPYRQQITLDKGSRHGVYRGQAVVDAHGILGQVVRVHEGRSTALMLTDPDHGIPVEVNRTGLQAIALGQGSNRGLRLPFLPGNADIKLGDLVVSSSLGGRFPVGYPVGRISEINHTPGGHFIEAVATPAARINQGRQALLVWSERTPIDEAQAREAAATEAAESAPPLPAGPAPKPPAPKPAVQPPAPKPAAKPPAPAAAPAAPPP